MKSLTKQKINGQQGFTLIELVVVIVILGILAVTAAPKFIDLTGDAKASVVEAVKGSLNSAADMAHAKAMVTGQNGVSGAISAAGTTINLAYGYPTAESINLLMDVDTSSNSSDPTFDLDGTGPITYSYKGVTTKTTCQAVYNQATTANVKPKITSNTENCN